MAVNAMIDPGFKTREVYRFCLANRWKAFKGDDAEYFLHLNKKANPLKTVRRIWMRTLIDPHFGSNLQGKTRPISSLSI